MVATIHIRDIQSSLQKSGQADAVPGSGGMFVEIRFDEPGYDSLVDDEMRNEVITCESPQGSVVITFDGNGVLQALDIS